MPLGPRGAQSLLLICAPGREASIPSPVNPGRFMVLFFCTLVFIGNISFAAADTASDTDTLLNWAENNYPTYFPTHEVTQSTGSWLYRFYSDTDIYVGVDTSDNGVYVFGGPWGNASPTYIDSLSNLLPEEINGKLTDVTSFVTGYRTFAIKADGTLWGWGLNHVGAIGDGTNVDRSTPVKVVGLSGVTSVVSGANATIALKSDGTVWAWGWNWQGDIGDGTKDTKDIRNTPVEINGLNDIIKIGEHNSVTSSSFYAIKDDGTLWIWGCSANNIFDSPHDIFCTNKPSIPTQINGFTDVVDFKSAGNGVVNSYYVLKSDGTVWAWGNNFSGQQGDGTNSNTFLPHGITGTDRDTPHQVPGLTGVKEIVVESNTGVGVMIMIFALKEDGTVWAWGENSSRLLGTGMEISSVDSPTQVSGLTGIIKISVNTSHSLALKNDGTVWAWGSSNLYGATGVGTGTAMDRITPTPTPVQLVGLSDIIDIVAGGFSSHALKGDGTVWGWGSGFLKSGTEVVHFTCSNSDPI
jgi:alpha-tubulin suppressor-like RCC1 family protein